MPHSRSRKAPGRERCRCVSDAKGLHQDVLWSVPQGQARTLMADLIQLTSSLL